MGTVSVAIPCLMQASDPNPIQAVVNVLERLGIRVVLPKRHTCCGQPAFNSGYHKQAAEVARHFLITFEQADVLVCPSGSCVHMIRHGFPILFADDPARRQAAAEIGKRTYEFTEFLVDVLHIEDVGARFQASVTYHDSCHLARALGIRRQPRALLSKVRDLQLIEMDDSDRCCGFGGTFSIKYPQISMALADDKIASIVKTGADIVVGCDIGCLMHIQGRLAKIHSNIQAMHLALILACS
uniref:(Fe-S)-binding protein n=1 Tax=Desulfatirhabdium butyrativorans TaxID=340467 RepID=A0A7C4RT81_9BACT